MTAGLQAARRGPGPSSWPLPRGEEKRTFVQRLFTSIAPRYDWFNRLASLGLDQAWRRAAVARGGIGPGQNILDVCAGTGDLSLLCAQRQRSSGVMVGLDMNAPMLQRAREKQRSHHLPVGWVRGDAESLPFPDGRVDRVVIGFSTRNLTNLDAGLKEMLRVLRPGGRLVILETGYPANPVLRKAYQAFLFTAARTVGFALTGQAWPFTYLARSVREFLTPGEMVARLQSCQTQVEYVPLSLGLASLFLATKS
jgi:demethylmenaquinone methyltransferase/2-methoxy-6-polyprenyl-1,4-benzoquinol methylase